MMQASSSNDSFSRQAYRGLLSASASADDEEQLSASAKLERAYIVSMGGILDTDGMMRRPSLGQMDAQKGAQLAMGPPPPFPGRPQQCLDRYPSLTSDAAAAEDFFAGVFDDEDEPMLTPEGGDATYGDGNSSVPSSIEIQQQHDVFCQSLQALEERKGATSPTTYSSQAYWTAQDAMSRVTASNQARHSLQGTPSILLTLTSFPFRIVHGTTALLTSQSLGAPLSTVLSSDYHHPSKIPAIPQAPVLSNQCTLLGKHHVNIQIIPVLSNPTTSQSRAALVYYAIVLQDEGGNSRMSSLSSGF